MLIDSHAHIDDEKFNEDREAVLANAREAGVEIIINPGADEASSYRAVEMSEKYPMVYATVGIHPHDAKDYDEKKHGALLKTWAEKEKVVAIGEIGLDYHYDYSPRDVQQEVFIKQMVIAKETALPIVIHNRESMEDMVRILKSYFVPEYGGIMHSYSGSVEMAKVFLEMGFYLSISGPLTFKNARKLPEVVAMMPLDRLLVETDSPYLTPTPYRGKRNEPAYVRLVAAEIARIRGISLEEVAEASTQNAKKVFGIIEK
ncbi:TatD family hydrolase [Acetobacterium woodii]|uniref:Mg-dependent deoxyribonuclease TatD family n=1 Tax=Acetobacterium woodii (strain ATCC 29683 / DSM 1030 / JCM 2381 / KCTC 1655 / WB1) TaxID=931626 RepID=H6LJ46_ACEWD|nr:TatD family hydrolase [Acetobacterium woodii]AFA47409.1 Mg-dependent deoxyribonuclease TatD family [Acetobacterium woodii DSM 1030]